MLQLEQVSEFSAVSSGTCPYFQATCQLELNLKTVQHSTKVIVTRLYTCSAHSEFKAAKIRLCQVRIRLHVYRAGPSGGQNGPTYTYVHTDRAAIDLTSVGLAQALPQ